MTLRKLGNQLSLYPASGADSTLTSVNQYGRNPDCAANASEEIWNGSVVYSWPATALMTHVSQTADQETMRGQTVHIHGLDGDWNPVEQDVVMDATLTTNAVALDPALLRVHFAEINSGVVVTGTPIRLHNAGETIDYFVMPVGNQTTALGWYTVPAGKVAYMTQYWAHHNPTSGQTFTSNLIRLWAKDNVNGYARKVIHQVGVPEDGGFVHPFEPYLKFTEKTDIMLTASPTSASADVSAGFDLLLTND